MGKPTMGSMFWSWFVLAVAMIVVGLAGLACAPAQQAPPKPAAETAKPAAAAEAKWPGKPAAIPILGGIPNAPPRPTPPPPPAGATPPPKPEPPAARTVPIYAHIDTVTAGAGESKFNVDANLSCVKTSLFSRGMHIVWRMEMVDTSTGKILQGSDVADATLKLPHGEELKFRYGRHGATEDAPWFFTAAWDVPMDYPLGVLDYSVAISTAAGKNVAVKDPLALLPGPNDPRVTIVPS